MRFVCCLTSLDENKKVTNSPNFTHRGSKVVTVIMKRQKMRAWLEQLLDSQDCPSLYWSKKSNRQFTIDWLHASSQNFDKLQHGDVFYRWAQHTGKNCKNHTNNKATFRSAIKSLKDCVEVSSSGDKKGEKAKRVFQFIDRDHPLYEEKKKTKDNQAAETLEPELKVEKTETNDVKEYEMLKLVEDPPSNVLATGSSLEHKPNIPFHVEEPDTHIDTKQNVLLDNSQTAHGNVTRKNSMKRKRIDYSSSNFFIKIDQDKSGEPQITASLSKNILKKETTKRKRVTKRDITKHNLKCNVEQVNYLPSTSCVVNSSLCSGGTVQVKEESPYSPLLSNLHEYILDSKMVAQPSDTVDDFENKMHDYGIVDNLSQNHLTVDNQSSALFPDFIPVGVEQILDSSDTTLTCGSYLSEAGTSFDVGGVIENVAVEKLPDSCEFYEIFTENIFNTDKKEEN